MSASPPPPFIDLTHVTRTFRAGSRSPVHALRDVSLALPAGSFTAVVGRSGSGKSTLLHLLAAMDRPTSGTVRVNGTDVAALDDDGRARYRRETVGMLFQRFHLVPTMNALDNAALPLALAGVALAERRDRAAALLARVGLGDRLDHRPTELSGGEQQRVALARALAHDPPLLLCDEPTGNLDSATAAEVIGLLATLHRDEGRAVVVVTHTPAEIAAVAERTLRMKDGAVAEEVVTGE
ncbi:MAG: ABC transporter ATP-binding protein [Bacteroidota bacterium]